MLFRSPLQLHQAVLGELLENPGHCLPGRTDLLGKLLVEIQNPCAEGLVMRDGLPVSERAGHGYGCRSIQTIAERRGGLCEFRARGGIFSMQLVLPVKAAAKTQD